MKSTENKYIKSVKISAEINTPQTHYQLHLLLTTFISVRHLQKFLIENLGLNRHIDGLLKIKFSFDNTKIIVPLFSWSTLDILSNFAATCQ